LLVERQPRQFGDVLDLFEVDFLFAGHGAIL
jgi:hypothetical protein